MLSTTSKPTHQCTGELIPEVIREAIPMVFEGAIRSAASRMRRDMREYGVPLGHWSGAMIDAAEQRVIDEIINSKFFWEAVDGTNTGEGVVQAQ